MKTIAQTILFHAIFLGLLYPYVEPGQFYGGSMSFELEKQPDGNQLVNIELITSWVLGGGPCGKSCNIRDIGRSTRSTRQAMESVNPNYLGTFSKEYDLPNRTVVIENIKLSVYSSFNETVIAVNEHGKIEQEMMHFSVIMEKERKNIDIRIKLGKVSDIRIPVVDADDDFIKCNIAKFVEGGEISLYSPPNVTVMEKRGHFDTDNILLIEGVQSTVYITIPKKMFYEGTDSDDMPTLTNCTVFINASKANGYKDDSWIAVPVSVRDYNKKIIMYGRGIYPIGKYSLSTTAVQFVVQILANLTTPEYVDPTHHGHHIFILFPGTEWRTQIYAEAPDITVDSDEERCFVLDVKRIHFQNEINVDCNENAWNIVVAMNTLRQVFPNAKGSDIYLGENKCTGTEMNGNLTFQQNLDECLTSRRIGCSFKIQNGSNIYSNELIYGEHDQVYTFIIRRYNWTVDVECDVNSDGIGYGFVKRNNTSPSPNISSPQYPVNISYFLDSNYIKEVSGNPLHVATGAQVYVKVFTEIFDWNTRMRVVSCYSKPAFNAPDHTKYYLLKNGCEVDTNTHIISQSSHETRFVFDNFEYTGNNDGIFVFCDTILCNSQDYSARCRQTCNPMIRRKVALEKILSGNTGDSK